MRRVLLTVLACGVGISPAAAYDPLAIDGSLHIKELDFVARHPDRERTTALKAYLPPARQAAPVVLFSHGLGGSKEGCRYLGSHWAARGYVAVFLQHAGSDDGVWRDVPFRQRRAAMVQAASMANLQLRVQDVRATLDALGRWHGDRGHALQGRIDLTRVGMSGHSFGARTTQVVGGQLQAGRDQSDARLRAAIAFSPSVPQWGDQSTSFGQVSIPWLLMTGTQDESPIGGQTAASRRKVYAALPGTIDRYELVLLEAQHSAFTDRTLPGEGEARNPNHHRVILAISTAFWDAYLREDADARDWLQGAGPRTVMAAGDLWQAAFAERAPR